MLSSMQLIKYWLPGVAGTQPRLGPVLGGRLRKGGLHQPPFYFVRSVFLRTNLSMQLPRLATGKACHSRRPPPSDGPSIHTLVILADFFNPAVRDPLHAPGSASHVYPYGFWRAE